MHAESLIERYLPHAPRIGLYVHPRIPEDKLKNALDDYALTVRSEDVLALYDATLMGTGKDGAVFTSDRIVFQNTNLRPAQEMRYDDVVNVSRQKRFLGGEKVVVDHNSGNATVTHTVDFSGKSKAAEYVARFLHEAMLYSSREVEDEPAPPESAARTGQHMTDPEQETDPASVKAALRALVVAGRLSETDYRRMMAVITER